MYFFSVAVCRENGT